MYRYPNDPLDMWVDDDETEPFETAVEDEG